mmetsp:Transcript_59160/g.193008  ORF Transcript_59160/g.193008 Transcript_59160/m.193008 type:complete len:319 (+) Transcript_59160:489-1445(+)
MGQVELRGRGAENLLDQLLACLIHLLARTQQLVCHHDRKLLTTNVCDLRLASQADAPSRGHGASQESPHDKDNTDAFIAQVRAIRSRIHEANAQGGHQDENLKGLQRIRIPLHVWLHTHLDPEAGDEDKHHGEPLLLHIVWENHSNHGDREGTQVEYRAVPPSTRTELVDQEPDAVSEACVLVICGRDKQDVSHQCTQADEVHQHTGYEERNRMQVFITTAQGERNIPHNRFVVRPAVAIEERHCRCAHRDVKAHDQESEGVHQLLRLKDWKAPAHGDVKRAGEEPPTGDGETQDDGDRQAHSIRAGEHHVGYTSELK